MDETYQRPPRDLGFGFLALIGAVIGTILGFVETAAWYRYLIIFLFLLGSLNCIIVRKYFSGIGWFLMGIGFLLGFYFYGRWGILAGIGVACIIITPLITKFEEKLI